MLLTALLSLNLGLTAAAPLLGLNFGPVVTINNGTILGSSKNGVDSFRGVPFAEPPIGDLRLRPPQSIKNPLPFIDASISQARGCPQFYTSTDQSQFILGLLGNIIASPLFQLIGNFGEDCLTVDIQRPSNISSSAKLPVLFWIFGGGFEFGATSALDGSKLVQKGVELGEPFIYVAVNYRVGGFGFLAGKELAAEGSTNLGLRDQRLGLQWVQENIGAFGGDPDKVTIWGQSAGAMSVFDHTVINNGDNTYNGKPLFRAAIMDSGAMIPVTNVSSAKPQAVFDTVVKSANCDQAEDVLSCLRDMDYISFLGATSTVPGIIGFSGLDISYAPRPDEGDDFYSRSPEISLAQGKFTKVPIITGNQEDEGTILSVFQRNLTDDNFVQDYFANFFSANPDAYNMVGGFLETYPNDPTTGQPFGSPFRSNSSYNIFPQYKRIAAISGDILCALQRRRILEYYSAEMPSWSYLSSYLHNTSDLGTYHGSDVPYAYGDAKDNPALSHTIQKYFISFITKLDPNALGTETPMISWPQYHYSESPMLLNLLNTSNQLIPDDFRMDAYNYLKENESGFRL